MADEKSPAFQLYTKDLLSDGNVLAMTLTEFGAYVKLMAICWNERGLPNDTTRLAKMLSISLHRFEQLWPAIEPCFYLDAEGRYQHKRLDKERQKQQDWHDKSSAGGKASAESRKGGSRVVEPPQEPNPNTALCSLQSASASAEEDHTAASEPAILTFPTDGPQREWGLTQSQVSTWTELYPGLDVLAECRKALAWIMASPDRRKTVKGMGKFLVAWLGRATDRPRSSALVSTSAPKLNRYTAAAVRAAGAPLLPEAK